MSSLEEALFCSRVGVDTLGLTLELPDGVHDGLTREKAAAIVHRLPKHLLVVVITYLNEADSACDLVHAVPGTAVQFHGGIDKAELMRFRKACPHIKTIGRVSVTGEDALSEARGFQRPLWDAIILDSLDPETGRKGATGLVHDWNISAAIVKNTRLPVILAGGLNPTNVGRAIEMVQPHAVDAHSGLEEPDGSRSFKKIQEFATAARIAFQKTGVA